MKRFVSPLTSASGTEVVLRVSTMDVSNDVLKRRLFRFIFAFGERLVNGVPLVVAFAGGIITRIYKHEVCGCLRGPSIEWFG